MSLQSNIVINRFQSFTIIPGIQVMMGVLAKYLLLNCLLQLYKGRKNTNEKLK